MENTQEWKAFSWHCVNCGILVEGYQNKKGDIKVECRRCRVVMIRKPKHPNQDFFHVYAPKGMQRI